MSFSQEVQKKYDFLLDEHKDNLERKEIEKLAMEAIEKQVDDGDIGSPTELLEKLSEYREQSVEELQILNKAIDLGKSPKVRTEVEKEASFGTLSEKYSVDGQENNLISFLLEDL